MTLKITFFRFWTPEAKIYNKTQCTGGQDIGIWSPGCIDTNIFTRSGPEVGFFGRQRFSLMKNRGHFWKVGLFLKRWVETLIWLRQWMSVTVYIDNRHPTCHRKYLYFMPYGYGVISWGCQTVTPWWPKYASDQLGHPELFAKGVICSGFHFQNEMIRVKQK